MSCKTKSPEQLSRRQAAFRLQYIVIATFLVLPLHGLVFRMCQHAMKDISVSETFPAKLCS